MRIFNFKDASHKQTIDQSFDNEHTTANPYCSNLSCWCHTNVEYHDEIQHTERRYTPEQVEQVYSFFGLRY